MELVASSCDTSFGSYPKWWRLNTRLRLFVRILLTCSGPNFIKLTKILLSNKINLDLRECSFRIFIRPAIGIGTTFSIVQARRMMRWTPLRDLSGAVSNINGFGSGCGLSHLVHTSFTLDSSNEAIQYKLFRSSRP